MYMLLLAAWSKRRRHRPFNRVRPPAAAHTTGLRIIRGCRCLLTLSRKAAQCLNAARRLEYFSSMIPFKHCNDEIAMAQAVDLVTLLDNAW
jgi:hypothetical protein